MTVLRLTDERSDAAGSHTAVVDVRQATRSYGDRHALGGVTFRLEPGGVTAVMGPSGCGKSTLVRLLAGLEPPDSGSVFVAPERIGVVFQEPRLLPWRNVLENVWFALGRPRTAETLDLARGALARVDLVAEAERWPAQLSGGMRQRVALARAIVVGPGLLLLDEPTSSLDLLTRRHMLDLVVDVSVTCGVTTCLVTHTGEDAASIAERVVVLRHSPSGGRVAGTLELGPCRERRSAFETQRLHCELSAFIEEQESR